MKEDHAYPDAPVRRGPDTQVLRTILDETLTSYKVEYRYTKLAKGLLMEKSWVVEYANIPDYPEAFDMAERLATMYRYVRVVRIEKTSKLTVAWASEEAL